MKKILLYLLLPALGMLSMSFTPDSLLNKPMPVLPQKTMDGATIDGQYFRGHVTLVTFMFIGCPPCMNEIGLLNKMADDYAGKGMQVLCVARQTRSQMAEFNKTDTGTYGSLRKSMKAEHIRYPIQPGCPDGPNNIRMRINGDDTIMEIHGQCTVIKETYGVEGFPSLFFVDKKGIIRKIEKGGPGERNAELDKWYFDKWGKEVELLLAEE